MDGHFRPAFGIVLALTLLLAACRTPATPESPTPEPEPSPTSTPVPADTPTPDLVPTDTPEGDDRPTPTAEPSPTPVLIGQRVEGGTLGSIWSLAAIRYSEQDDHFRLVLEMEEAGTTVPFYTAELTDEDSDPFPGERDPAWGTVRIDLVVSDLYGYDYPDWDQLPIEVEDDPLVTAITRLPIFDDALLGFSIWLESPAPFEVHELTEPVRLAVDVFYP